MYIFDMQDILLDNQFFYHHKLTTKLHLFVLGYTHILKLQCIIVTFSDKTRRKSRRDAFLRNNNNTLGTYLYRRADKLDKNQFSAL